MKASVIVPFLLLSLHLFINCGYGVVTTSPTNCANTKSYPSSFNSLGILTLNIKTVGTTLDELQINAPTSSQNVLITSTVYSSSSVDVNSYTFASSRSKLTLSYTATLTSTQSTSVCKARTVVSVSAPATVHTICFNNNCYCNCATKNAGVNIHFTVKNENVYNTLNYTGFGLARMDFMWEFSEKSQNVYDWYEWNYLTTRLTARDVRPLYILDYANPLYNGGKAPSTIQSQKSYANWAANATKYFQNNNIIWELYNEPNHVFWTPYPNVTDYINLVKTAGQQIKATTPSETLVGPALALYDKAFISSCLQAGLLNYWDAVSVHFYRTTGPELVRGDYADLRQLIRKNLPSDKLYVGILSSEWGYTTVINQPNDGRTVTETQQAQYFVRQHLTNFENDVPVSVWYDFNDDGTDPSNSEHRFGLYKNTYKTGSVPAFDPKPAALAAKYFYSKIGNLRYNKRIVVPDANSYVHLFTDGEIATQIILVVWSSSSSAVVKIPSSPGSFTVTNMYGDSTSTLTVSAGFLTITATQSPQYLVPTSSNPLLSIAAATRRLPIEITGVGWGTVPIVVKNPLGYGIQVKIHNEATVSLSSGQSAFSSISYFNDLRNIGATKLSYVVQVVNIGNITLTTNVIYDYPITFIPSQVIASGCVVDITNPTGKAFNGNLSFIVNGRVTNYNLILINGQTKSSVTIPTGLTTLTQKFALSLNVYNTAKAIISTSSGSYQLAEDLASYAVNTLPSSISIVASGTTSVVLSYNIKIGTPPTPKVPVLFLTYNVAPGWRYILVNPTTPVPIIGTPKGIGIWIYGDGKGNFISVRLRDSTGQTFQYPFGAINFTGWQYMRVALGSPQGYWGGDNDGVLHPPLFFETYLSWDSNQVGSSGTIYFSAPTAYF